MHNLAGNFKILFVAFFLVTHATSVAKAVSPIVKPSQDWLSFSERMDAKANEDRRLGLSYIISGTLGLAGGIAGAVVAQDEIERGVYSVFQTIGVAAIGYGSYTWLVGDEERSFYALLQAANLAPQQKRDLIEIHDTQKKAREKKERVVKAITHGLIAALNIYSAQQQQNSTLKTGLYFIGGVNLLAAASFTFEF